MINANELMVGNWIFARMAISRVKQLRQVNAIDIEVCCDDPGRFEPIPISTETLEKSGFEKEGYYWGDYYSNKHLQLMKNKTGEGYFLLNGEDVVYWNKVYLYVHELQNLHFILTGEELDVKL